MSGLRPTRRAFASSAAGLFLIGCRARANTAHVKLRTAAARKGLFYGAAAEADKLRADASFAGAVAKHCAFITPENDMKWGQMEAVRGQPSFQKSDDLVAFARRNGLLVRGHTVLWHRNLPAWAPEALKAEGAEVARRRVRDIVTRYRGATTHWDVLNEAIEPTHNLEDGLRRSPFLEALGPDYIADAYRTAHAADPTARLYYNDYGLEYDTPQEDARRAATLNLLRRLKEAGAPIHGLGVQSHLKVGNRFDDAKFRDFLAQAASLDLDIVISELDINDSRLPLDIDKRDQRVAEHARHFLDVALDEAAVKGVVTWGLSDRYTWLNPQKPPQPGERRQRPLPLDDQLSSKPLFDAILGAIKATRSRR